MHIEGKSLECTGKLHELVASRLYCVCINASLRNREEILALQVCYY